MILDIDTLRVFRPAVVQDIESHGALRRKCHLASNLDDGDDGLDIPVVWESASWS